MHRCGISDKWLRRLRELGRPSPNKKCLRSEARRAQHMENQRDDAQHRERFLHKLTKPKPWRGDVQDILNRLPDVSKKRGAPRCELATESPSSATTPPPPSNCSAPLVKLPYCHIQLTCAEIDLQLCDLGPQPCQFSAGIWHGCTGRNHGLRCGELLAQT